MNRDIASKYIEENFIEHADRFQVSSMYIGLQHKNNTPTDSLAIVYVVPEKLPKIKLPKHKLIPKTIKLGDIEVITDVVEQDIVYHFENELCHNIYDINDWELMSHNRKLNKSGSMYDITRKTGLSIMNLSYSINYKNKHGTSNAFQGIRIGTLGIFARDEQDGKLVAVSNNHVLTPDFVTADLQGGNPINYKNNIIVSPGDDQIIMGTDVSVGYMTIQERHVVDGIEYKMGEVKRSWGLRRLNNEIDAAISSTTIDLNNKSTQRAIKHTFQSNKGSFNSCVPINMNIDYNMKWATSREIDLLVIGTEGSLFRSGWGSGPVGYPVSTSNKTCQMYTSGVHFSGFVSGKQFKNVIQYKGLNGLDPSTGGDSGSPLCAFISGEWKLIGIHFAGGMDRITGEHHALACRIDKIAEKMKISRWDGRNVEMSSPNNYSVDVSPTYAVLPGLRSDQTLVIDGKTYYQVGRTSNPNTHIERSDGTIATSG